VVEAALRDLWATHLPRLKAGGRGPRRMEG
jgi:hypothetical protein